MNATVLWDRYQDWLYYHEGLSFYLDVSRMKFDSSFVAEMQPKFDHAFREMAALEAGAIANPDENRMVGHYWLRGEPGPLSERVACIDYSVAKGGKLAAYRWNGEAAPVKDNFVCVG